MKLATPEGSSDAPRAARSSRIHGFDVIRGFSVISMVAFHFCYDLKFIAGYPLSWFAPPLQDVWRATISWTFIFVAGAMFAWSRDNLRRSCRYLLAAAAVFAVTLLASVDVPISFGVIYCMGSCTLCCWLLERLSFAPEGQRPRSSCFVASCCCGAYPRVTWASDH